MECIDLSMRCAVHRLADADDSGRRRNGKPLHSITDVECIGLPMHSDDRRIIGGLCMRIIGSLLLVLSSLTCVAATSKLPEALQLADKESPFSLRMVMGCSPFYPMGGDRMSGAGSFWDQQWRFDFDSQEGPNYVHAEKFEKALPRFEGFCRTMSQLGCNAIVLGDVIHLVTLDNLVPGDPYAIYGPDDVYRKRHLFYREYFRKLIGIARDYGLDFYIYSDEFVYTPPLAKWIGEISDANPKLWEAYRAKYDELLTELPEAAGVLIRLGEIYVYSGYQGKDVVNAAGTEPERYRRLIRETWEIVCKKHAKTYIHRTWACGVNQIHSQADIYERVWRGLPTEGIVVSIKHPQTDFWYFQPPNPTIGLGEHKQIVEFQTRREYDGMGVFPACPWPQYRDAMRRIAHKGNVIGYWIWPNEGGGPNGVGREPQTHYTYLDGFAAWNEANTYLVAALGHDPNGDVKAILRTWAAATYGESAADAIVEILLTSDRVMECAKYISDYPKTHLWVPDASVRWFVMTLNGYDPYKELLVPGAIRRMAAEGQEAYDLACRQLALFEGIEGTIPDRDLARDTRESLQHQRAFCEFMRDWRETMLYYFQARLRGGPEAVAAPDAKVNTQQTANEEAGSFCRMYLDARRRVEASLAAYDRDWHLYDTRAARDALKRMETGALE
jgi:hypothetical protein